MCAGAPKVGLCGWVSGCACAYGWRAMIAPTVLLCVPGPASSWRVCVPLSRSHRCTTPSMLHVAAATHTETDRQTDKQTDRQTHDARTREPTHSSGRPARTPTRPCHPPIKQPNHPPVLTLFPTLSLPLPPPLFARCPHARTNAVGGRGGADDPHGVVGESVHARIVLAAPAVHQGSACVGGVPWRGASASRAGGDRTTRAHARRRLQ
jgi:hypothetical protein